MYQHPTTNTHLLPFSPQSGVVGMNCWYGKSRDLFFCEFFFLQSKVNSCWVFLLVSAKQQLVCEGGIPGFRMFVCFHSVVLPELLDPSYVVMVKT